MQPTGLDLDLARQVLAVTWADGRTTQTSLETLRRQCPCASCRTQREEQSRTLLPVLKSAPGGPVVCTGGHLVGNYALQLDWSDGHNTGIYDFRFLRNLAAPDEQSSSQA
jgi:DUF971 family protein